MRHDGRLLHSSAIHWALEPGLGSARAGHAGERLRSTTFPIRVRSAKFSPTMLTAKLLLAERRCGNFPLRFEFSSRWRFFQRFPTFPSCLLLNITDSLSSLLPRAQYSPSAVAHSYQYCSGKVLTHVCRVAGSNLQARSNKVCLDESTHDSVIIGISINDPF